MSDTSSREMSRSPSNSSGSTNITSLSSSQEFETKPSGASKSAFQRWRPSYHLQAPSGWMNDPCAPHYNPATGLYHVSYQSSLDLTNADWGEISWRTATSPDLVSWDVKHEPTLIPDTPYDGKGVFTGCNVPSRDGSLTYVYTSIGALPIHHTLPHVKGSESLSMAKSHDNGLTWQKYASNPILPSEPPNLEVTGFRDPFVSAWPSMAAALDLDAESTLFGIISGGIRDVTPTTFLYSIEAADPTKWTYIGPLVNFGLNSRPSKWSGDLGVNWEVTNFATLSDSSDPSVSREFLIMGTEGCLPSALSPSSTSTTPTRPARNQLWMSGPLARASPSNSSSPVTMPFAFGSHLDHGAFYAANSFFCPKLRKHVVWGWVTEEDLCDELRREQGWSGMLSLPREISLQTMRNVVGAWSSDLKSITSVECEAEAEGQGAYTVRTLASEPVREVVEKLRRSARAATSAKTSGTALPGRDGSGLAFDVRTTAWELDVGFRLAKTCREVGVQIVHSSSVDPTHPKTTTLSFAPACELLTLTPPSSVSTPSQINTAPTLAPHTLFTTRHPRTGDLSTEPLHVRAWRDNSVLEVFVNGRTALSARLYEGCEGNVGVRFYAEDSEGEGQGGTEVAWGRVWDGIGG